VGVWIFVARHRLGSQGSDKIVPWAMGTTVLSKMEPTGGGRPVLNNGTCAVETGLENANRGDQSKQKEAGMRRRAGLKVEGTSLKW